MLFLFTERETEFLWFFKRITNSPLPPSLPPLPSSLRFLNYSFTIIILILAYKFWSEEANSLRDQSKGIAKARFVIWSDSGGKRGEVRGEATKQINFWFEASFFLFLLIFPASPFFYYATTIYSYYFRIKYIAVLQINIARPLFIALFPPPLTLPPSIYFLWR